MDNPIQTDHPLQSVIDRCVDLSNNFAVLAVEPSDELVAVTMESTLKLMAAVDEAEEWWFLSFPLWLNPGMVKGEFILFHAIVLSTVEFLNDLLEDEFPEWETREDIIEMLKYNGTAYADHAYIRATSLRTY